MRKKQMNSGITLIALVVTIVVLLIFAGVSISALTGDNGIITQAQETRIETKKGQYKEEINIIAVGEEMRYQTDEIGFDEMVSAAKALIEAKDYVESVTQKTISSYVVLEAQTDLNIVSVKFSEKGIQVLEGTIEPPQEANPDIFNYTTAWDGTISIIGFNFSNLTYEANTDSIYNFGPGLYGDIIIKDLEILKIPEEIDGKAVTSVQLNQHINYKYGEDVYVIQGIKEIIYPNTMKSLGGMAEGSTRLPDVESITLNEGLESLEVHAMSGFEKITNITIPESVMYVYACAFSGFNYHGSSSHLEINVKGKDSISDFNSAYGLGSWALGNHTNSTYTVNYLGK